MSRFSRNKKKKQPVNKRPKIPLRSGRLSTDTEELLAIQKRNELLQEDMQLHQVKSPVDLPIEVTLKHRYLRLSRRAE